jgi:hypothetical protein
VVDRLDHVRKKLGPATTNARRLAAPGIGALRMWFLAAMFGLACSSESGTTRSPVIDSLAADSIARARRDSINRTLPGYVVDSILPVEEELRRFRIAIGGDSVSGLDNAAPSRDSLVKGFIAALARSDTTALQKMLLNAREFAWLVYPESPYTRPPYSQSPALVWGQIQNPGASGYTRLVRRLGGKPLRYDGYTCSPKPDRQGKNVIWTQCTVRVAEPGEGPRNRRLFGSIIERNGRFKLVSFANEF